MVFTSLENMRNFTVLTGSCLPDNSPTDIISLGAEKKRNLFRRKKNLALMGARMVTFALSSITINH